MKIDWSTHSVIEGMCHPEMAAMLIKTKAFRLREVRDGQEVVRIGVVTQEANRNLVASEIRRLRAEMRSDGL